MKIGNIDLEKEVLIVAEIGNNHEGSCALAEEMIGLAARAGAGAVKFQTIVPERLIAPHQKERLQQLKKFQLGQDEFERLARVARQEDILFLSTPFDIDSLHSLTHYVPAFKIASGDNNFFPLIREAAATGKPILLSSGMSTLNDMRLCRDYIYEIWKEKGLNQELAILHCVVSYPTPAREANLLAIRALKDLGVTPGYSDHTLGIDAAVFAVAVGARIIEKHFTIRKDQSDYHDHSLSADPAELSQLVERVQQAIEMLGDGIKRVSESEAENACNARRSIVAIRDLKKGDLIGWNDLDWLRPGGGLVPGCESDLLDKALLRPIAKGEVIRHEDVCSMEKE